MLASLVQPEVYPSGDSPRFSGGSIFSLLDLPRGSTSCNSKAVLSGQGKTSNMTGVGGQRAGERERGEEGTRQQVPGAL